MITAAPGDVLAVATADNWARRLILLGGILAGKRSPANHVVIITHRDALGRWIGIQGQPGGVGMTDCTGYLTDPRTRSNHLQLRAAGQGQLTTFLASAVKSLGIGYDWAGIAEDTAMALHAPDLSAVIDDLWRWSPDPADPQLHGEVVCSSLAAMLYDLPQVGWRHPDLGAERRCTPADWWLWSDQRQWEDA